MATKKGTPAPAGKKSTSATGKGTQQRVVARAIPTDAGSDPRQLMREAAWARMFGRAEAKNPFTR